MSNKESNIKLEICDDEIVYQVDNKTQWTIPISELVFIGEYTTSTGPWFDDWFYVFSNEYDTWYEVPFQAQVAGNLQFWTYLSEKLNSVITPALVGSTVWATNVIYPKTLEGEELFTVITVHGEPKTFWQRMFRRNNNSEKIVLTDKVKALFTPN